MGAYNRKGGIYPLAFFVMLILISTYCDGSDVLVESNTTSSCNGGLGECLIEDDLEFLVKSNPYRTVGFGIKNKPFPCGRPGDPYHRCINDAKCVRRGQYFRC
uniref:Wall-associated receptor kinase galacturonan-binding domain-containing protein n=1 Tax=Fagus sylvatica TaxID=28930 RepID=A0A2N9ILD3_FAGSY